MDPSTNNLIGNVLILLGTFGLGYSIGVIHTGLWFNKANAKIERNE